MQRIVLVMLAFCTLVIFSRKKAQKGWGEWMAVDGMFVAPLVEHCNLNCKYCSHYSPLGKYGLASVERFEKDFERLVEIAPNKVKDVALLGGEPLLHPQLMDFLKIGRRLFPDAYIRLVTNGLLLSKQDECFWMMCGLNKIAICITNYPIQINRKLIKLTAKQYGVVVKYDPEDTQRRMRKAPLDLTGGQNAHERYEQCWIRKNCGATIKDGKLYGCYIPVYVRQFNDFFRQNVEVTEQDYLDLYNITDVRTMEKFLEQPYPICRYCALHMGGEDTEWSKSERKIEEWT
jgi:MoaA/NifB/PqqE/SkfB family radical SAM enzyme